MQPYGFLIRCVLIGLALCKPIWAGISQTRKPAMAINQFVHTKWDMEARLASRTLHALAQTEDGYLWIGSEEGVSRFDGSTFQHLPQPPVSGWRNSKVTALCAGAGAYLWIGTEDGLLRYDRRNLVRFGTEEGLPHTRIRSLWAAPDGALWIGTVWGAATLREGKVTPVVTPPGNQRVFSLMGNAEGVPLIGCERVCSYQSGEFRPTSMGLPGQNLQIQALHQDVLGTLWIGTPKGLYKVEDGQPRPVPLFGEPHKEFVECLTSDAEGNLWVGTRNGLVVRHPGGGLDTFDANDGLTHNNVHTLLVDREANIWVGTHAGLNRFYRGRVIPWTHQHGLPGDQAKALLEDQLGRLWVGTHRGLAHFQEGRFHEVPLPRDLTHIARTTMASGVLAKGVALDPFNVKALFEGRDHSLWVGLSQAGLARLKEGRWTLYGLKDGLPDLQVNSILEDRQGRLWVGTSRGVVRFPGAVPRLSGRKLFLTNNKCLALLERRDGTIWGGTSGQGPFRIAGEEGTLLRRGHPLDQAKCQFLKEDPDGTLWIGTYGTGLFMLRQDGLYHSTILRGLPDNQIHHLQEDEAGYVWISGNKGIFRIHHRDLVRHMVGDSVPEEAWLKLGRVDGMRNRECNGMSQAGGCRTRDGRIWFATEEGVAMVDPRRGNQNTVPPLAVIDRIVVGQRQEATLEGAALSPQDRDLAFHFGGLGLRITSRVRVQYRLEGYDQAWVEGEANRVATYANLPPGPYRFLVRACNEDGLWSLQNASCAFRIRTPFWSSWWFRTLAVAAAAILIHLLGQQFQRLLEQVRFWRRAHTIGPYRILSLLGQGGMATVYRARDKRTGREVAVKVIHEELQGPEIPRRFAQECEICLRVRHPNMIRILDHGESEGRLYLAMELCHGITLRAWMQEHPRDSTDCLRLLRALLETLQELHALGIVHRDLKPENILFRGGAPGSTHDLIRQRLVLLDFGLARLSEGRSLTKTGSMIGTVDYLPPEYLRGENIGSPSIDAYSLGIIFYELITGRVPYGEGGSDLMQRVWAIAYKPAPHASSVCAEVPRDCSELAMAMIAKNPTQRPSMASSLSQVEALLAVRGALA